MSECAQPHHMYTLEEAAEAYALAAERLYAGDDNFLDAHPAIVPIFVSHLFQSLEISIKHVGVTSGLFTLREARQKQNRSGHGIKQLAALAVERLGGKPFDPIVMALTYPDTNGRVGGFVRHMICGDDMEMTRASYETRRLGYAELKSGDLAIIRPISEWIEAVKWTARNLPRAVDIVSQWKDSTSSSKHFAIWIASP